MMSMPVFASAETKVIAHRGFWKTEGSAQNSITALKKAAEINVYGSEFDVLITSDGIPVVNHDDTIEGFVIEKTPYDKIKNLKLTNGETLPTIKEYLIVRKKHPNLKLVLEIKPHSNDETDIKAARIIDKMVKDMNLQNQVDYISFSKTICKELGKLTPSSNIA